MKTLYIECGMGAAGDMLTAALLELIPDPDIYIDKLNSLGIPDVKFTREKSVKCGITGTHITVTVAGVEEGSEMHDHHDHEHSHEHSHDGEHEHHHEHSHDGEHTHHHSHASMDGIRHIVCDHMDLPAKVREDVLSVYSLIADAESHVHGVPIENIHFHEVGRLDAIADIVGTCLIMNWLQPVHLTNLMLI